MNVCIIPRSISLVTLNGFPKLDLDIVMKPVKLYKTSSDSFGHGIKQRGAKIKLRVGP
jgi:hypothetical protein